MPGIHDLWLFVLAGVMLNITPGPDTVYVIGRSLQLGWRGGAMAACGISCGCLVHVTGAAIGLSALLMASSTAFSILKWVGAAYLAWMGLQLLLSRPTLVKPAQADSIPPALARVFLQGVLTNALNPKVALFFLAFLPQFVAADARSKPLAFVALGLIFVCTGALWLLVVAAFAGNAAQRLRGSATITAWVNRALGAVFVYLGCRLALLEAR